MTQLDELGLREDDPRGAKFYMYPAKPLKGDWSYIVDDYGIAYQSGTLWPFRSTDRDDDRQSVASLVRNGEKRGEDWRLGEGCGWRSVRFSPDLDYPYAGGQNYVSVWPDMREAWKAHADLHLYVRPQGQGGITMACSLAIDLRDMTGTITTWPIDGSPIAADGFSEDFPGTLKAQAGEIKAGILALLADHAGRRNAGKRRIVTHRDRWYVGKPAS